MRGHDLDEYKRFDADKMAFARFQPVVFHYQLLADFGTIEEMAGVLFDELAR
ncbi:MAG: hypothetical protein JWP23_2761 [Phenylobacterium sp.]|jgi:hypothetical protein|nr:hypothetical protein [Phenylobacterium sp.]